MEPGTSRIIFFLIGPVMWLADLLNKFYKARSERPDGCMEGCVRYIVFFVLVCILLALLYVAIFAVANRYGDDGRTIGVISIGILHVVLCIVSFNKIREP